MLSIENAKYVAAYICNYRKILKINSTGTSFCLMQCKCSAFTCHDYNHLSFLLFCFFLRAFNVFVLSQFLYKLSNISFIKLIVTTRCGENFGLGVKFSKKNNTFNKNKFLVTMLQLVFLVNS